MNAESPVAVSACLEVVGGSRDLDLSAAVDQAVAVHEHVVGDDGQSAAPAFPVESLLTMVIVGRAMALIWRAGDSSERPPDTRPAARRASSRSAVCAWTLPAAEDDVVVLEVVEKVGGDVETWLVVRRVSDELIVIRIRSALSPLSVDVPLRAMDLDVAAAKTSPGRRPGTCRWRGGRC